MKLFIFACVVAVASAIDFHPGAQHLPVIGPNGVPVDTPAVQQATAEHLSHKAAAVARNGDYPAIVHPVYHPAASTGVPEDTPEVAVAKANHFAAHAEALTQNAHPYYYYRARRDVISPFAYSTYDHTPYGYNNLYNHFYRVRRDVGYTPYYSPYHHTAYSTYPYAHHY